MEKTIEQLLAEIKRAGKDAVTAGRAAYEAAEQIGKLFDQPSARFEVGPVEPGDASSSSRMKYRDDGFTEPNQYGARSHVLIEDLFFDLMSAGKQELGRKVATHFVFYGGPDGPHPLNEGLSPEQSKLAGAAIMETWDRLIVAGSYSDNPIFAPYYLISKVPPPENRKLTAVDRHLICYPDFGPQWPDGRMPAEECVLWYVNGIRAKAGLKPASL